LALTEPDYSWQPAAIKTTAEEKNGKVVLNGTKLFVSDAAAASHLLVAARTGPAEDEVALFLVDAKSAGVAIRRLEGFFSGANFEVKLASVEVPAENRLGDSNSDWSAVAQGISRATPVLCAYMVGGCQSVIEQTLEFSRTRVQFGQAIGRFQRIQDMILEMVDKADAARWTTYEALWKLDTDQPAAESVHLAKAIASEAYWEVCTLAHRVFSGISYSMEHPVSFHTRASRSLYNLLGEPAYHRQQLARLILA
jgi:alkylation response protein AidB-like acyl-CoA dehydrogenase